MRLWIDIEDSDHDVVGEGPISNVIRATTHKRLSRAGEFSFEVPATDPRASLIVARRGASIYGMIDGVKRYLGGGQIEEMRTRIGTDGLPILSVSGGDLLRELVRILTGNLELNGTGNFNVDSLLDGIVPTPLEWAYTRDGDSPNFKGRLVYEPILGAMVAIAEKTGAMFRQEEDGGEPRHVRWFYANGVSGILATMHGDPVAIESNPNACLITNIEIAEDAFDVKTHAFVWGAGEGASQFSMASATHWPDGATLITSDYTYEGQTYRFARISNRIINLTALAAYGQDEVALAFKDIGPLTNNPTDMISGANYLVLAAVEWMHQRRMPYTAYRLSVAGLDATLEPGQTILVHARRFRDGEKPINVNATLYVLEIENTIDTNGVRTTGLTVANLKRWPVTGNEEIVREMGATKVLSAHPQTGPNVDTIPYREHLDDDHDATLYFWLGEETTTVQSVIVRFRVDPLRSTVKSIAGTSMTTPSGGGSTTESGGGTTSGSGGATLNHAHALEIKTFVASPAGQDLYVDSSDGLNIVTGSSGTVQRGSTTLVDTDHTHDNPDHAHNTPDHEHTFTPTIDTAYGVFDESGGNTYVATDLEYNVNGGSYTAVDSGDEVAGASGWYQIDITTEVMDADNFQPIQAANTVAFRVKAASEADKSAQLTVQIERRTSVQSIAVY